jgi:hypothetical protein
MTLQKQFLCCHRDRGIILGLSNLPTFEANILEESKSNAKRVKPVKQGPRWELIDEKNRESRIS